MEVDLKEVIALFIFIVVGVVFLGPITSYVQNVTTPGSYTTYVTTSGTVTETTSSFVSNPNYVGSNAAPLVSLVPLLFILILMIVPAVIAYKKFKG